MVLAAGDSAGLTGLKHKPRGDSGLWTVGLSGKYKLGLKALLGFFSGCGEGLCCVLRGGLGGSMLSCRVGPPGLRACFWGLALRASASRLTWGCKRIKASTWIFKVIQNNHPKCTGWSAPLLFAYSINTEQLYVLSHDRSWGRGWAPVKLV